MTPAPTTCDGLRRRDFLRVAAAGGAAVVLSGLPGAAWAAGANGRGQEAVRVYVLVVDGWRPDELSPTVTPRLAALRDGGTHFPSARSVPVFETLPNHAMMMTGVGPDRTGVPANKVYDRVERAVRDLDRPSDLRFPTVIETLGDRGLTTGTVLSKQYLYGLFGERATYRWEPHPVVPVSEHAPDQYTVDALIAMVDTADPDFVFVNLGDVDRVGHADLTGTTLQAARLASLASTDAQVGRFVDHLSATGRWDSSVLIVLADHSMDWSDPHKVISVDAILDDTDLLGLVSVSGLLGQANLSDFVVIAQNGGADLLYWVGPDDARAEALAAITEKVAAHPGVLEVRPPSELGLGAEAGDLVALCRPGWRFSDPYVVSNPIPGNHGHPVTAPIPFFVTGGHPRVVRGRTATETVTTLDVAPTVGKLFRLPSPPGGYDGKVLESALA